MMVGYPYGSLITAILLISAAGFTLGRHFLLEPNCASYPKAPLWVRHAMFGFGVSILFIGLQYLWVFVSGEPDTIPPQPPASMQFMATALFLYKGAMLLNILRQRYPAEVWERLHKINDIVACPPGQPRFLSWLNKQ